MRKAPRTKRLALALALACAATAARAEQGAGSVRTPDARTSQAKQAAKSPRETRAAAAAREQRARRRAAAVLIEVSADARSIEDPYQRASVLALCADALWETDEQAARSAFARAWEAAAESDEADLKEEQEGGRYGDLPERFTRARSLVLAAAARRDSRLSETWLGALAGWLSSRAGGAREEENPEEGEAGRGLRPLDELTVEGQRLALASALLEDESYDAAARVAAPAARGAASGDFVEFLLRLREGAGEEADRLYLRLLASARADAGAGAQAALLLSSYALTPRLLTAVAADGSIRFRTLGGAGGAGPADSAPPPHVRAAFYETAAALLLRPAQTAAQGAEANALFFTLGRLLPFFEREAPRHAPALRARLSEASAALNDARRAALESQMKTQRLTPSNQVDPLRGMLDEVARANGDQARSDAARLIAVEAAARMRLWERARRLAEEIEDRGSKDAARAVIDLYQLASVRETYTGDDDDYEKAAALARSAELAVPALRAYGFAYAAELAARRGLRERAEALLQDAFNHASQVEAGGSARGAAAMMLATTAARVQSPRAFEAAAAAVAALNEDEEFDGDLIWFNLDARVQFRPGEAGALNQALQPFDLAAMFAAAARLDFTRAVAEARNLKSPPARARALVAAARSELLRRGAK